MEQKELQGILKKHAEGRLSVEQQQALDQWYADFDQQEDTPVVFKNEAHQELIYHRLLQRIYAGLEEKNRSVSFPVAEPEREGKSAMRYWLSIAAVFAFFSLSIPLYFYISPAVVEKDNPKLVAMLMSKTPVGKMMEVTLEDGSVVLLNAATILKYPKHFNGEIREVYLEGEALFKIRHDPHQPFIVHSGALTTRVLGTSFNIRAYPGMDNVKVNVAEGKVGVQLKKKTIGLLLPNQQLSFQVKNQRYELGSYDAGMAASWRSGKIRLEGASFDELAVLIRNVYGYVLETDQPALRKTTFKISLNSYDKIDAVMSAISRIPDAKYRIKDKKISMY